MLLTDWSYFFFFFCCCNFWWVQMHGQAVVRSVARTWRPHQPAFMAMPVHRPTNFFCILRWYNVSCYATVSCRATPVGSTIYKFSSVGKTERKPSSHRISSLSSCEKLHPCGSWQLQKRICRSWGRLSEVEGQGVVSGGNHSSRHCLDWFKKMRGRFLELLRRTWVNTQPRLSEMRWFYSSCLVDSSNLVLCDFSFLLISLLCWMIYQVRSSYKIHQLCFEQSWEVDGSNKGKFSINYICNFILLILATFKK